MKCKGFLLLCSFLLLFLAAGCRSGEADFSFSCKEKDAIFCEDFEGVDPSLGGSQLVVSTSVDQWWVVSDNDQDSLYQDFPLAGRSGNNLILLGGNQYQDLSRSFLYTREIDLTTASRAALAFNLIYRTERHWDGLVIFGITDGVEGAKDPGKWALLTPQEGYPDSVLLNGKLVPGYSGVSAGWVHPEFDLSSFLGKKVILGFYFTSDDYLNDWGIGLDDIVVTADSGQAASQMAGLTDLAISQIAFLQDPLISPNLPRANPLLDTRCVMKDDLLLTESQRAIIKAISDSGERVMVLHPLTGSFCWVDQDDIWIDGQTGMVPSLVEKSRNTYFLINSLAHTPTAAGATCVPGTADSLPLGLQSVLVEKGKITALQFTPLQAGGDPGLLADPRVGRIDGLAAFDLKRSPGGEIKLEINGISHSCQSDWKNPGNVVCLGLDQDAAGPLSMEICWVGWDEMHTCPLGYFLDPKSSSCVPVLGSEDCSLDCAPGYFFDHEVKNCQVDFNNKSLLEDLDSCPSGLLSDPSSRRCTASEYSLHTLCPPGYFYSLNTGSCWLLEDGTSCPDGYRALEDSRDCIPVNIITSPRCKSFEIDFPTAEVTVKETTRCLKNPRNSNEIVSSLKAFQLVEVLGLGEGGEWLVVINPDYEIPCWAPLSDFYLDKLDVEIQPIIPMEEVD